ncbi:DUF4142 domain-containing protein [Sphingosinicella sp. CPCC 101087]|uniref:DUF4142 domain-containing protein n=1 Tax=Sphingosinicella sp. CPCC 101087 TaxID=2497754 RepID=UPI001FB191B9|nr:DUF4142 domain-containing protein [Sphingosinicella sp. CPCC 101087]
MMRSYLIALAGSATLIVGCAPMDDGATSAAAAAAGDATPEERTAYVAMAGSSDLYEIQSGQLAQQKAQRDELRQFGQMLVQHHTQTTQQVMSAARSAGMNPPPPSLTPMHRRMLDDLQQASGAAFDNLFVRQQIQAHEMALGLHQNYARNGDAPPLRTAANSAVPIITQHLERARQLD